MQVFGTDLTEKPKYWSHKLGVKKYESFKYLMLVFHLKLVTLVELRFYEYQSSTFHETIQGWCTRTRKLNKFWKVNKLYQRIYLQINSLIPITTNGT